MIVSEANIDRFISQICVGYSADLVYTYYDETIMYKDGSTKSRRVKYREGFGLPFDANFEQPAIRNEA